MPEETIDHPHIVVRGVINGKEDTVIIHTVGMKLSEVIGLARNGGMVGDISVTYNVKDAK